MDDTPYRLAYESSVRAIEDQARVLEDLRSRSATLVAAAALVTGFLGDAALTRADGLEPLSWAGLATASFIGTALAAFVVLWPVAVGFSLSAAAILGVVRDRAAQGNPVDSTEALGASARAAVRPERTADPAPLVGVSQRYPVSVNRGRRMDGGALEALMAKKPDNGTPRPKPKPQWPDISKPDVHSL